MRKCNFTYAQEKLRLQVSTTLYAHLLHRVPPISHTCEKYVQKFIYALLRQFS